MSKQFKYRLGATKERRLTCLVRSTVFLCLNVKRLLSTLYVYAKFTFKRSSTPSNAMLSIARSTLSIRAAQLLSTITYTFCLLTLLNCTHAQGSSLYYDCVHAWDFGETDTRIISVKPIGDICYKRCQNECNAFARSVNSPGPTEEDFKQTSANNLSQLELNRDIIEQCTLACQKGEIFTSKYREVNPETKSAERFIWKDAVSTKTYCGVQKSSIDSADYAFFPSGLSIDAGEKIRVIMVNPGSAGVNTVYLCGYNSVKLFPSFRSYSKTDWDNNKTKWIPDSSASRWNARNYIWTDTKIDVKDGDYLMIRYSGNFFTGASVSGNVLNFPINHKLQIRGPGPGDWLTGGDTLGLPGDKLQTLGMSVPPGCSDENYEKCNIKYDGDPQSIKQNNDQQIWRGLMPQVTEETRPMLAVPKQVDPKILPFIRDSQNKDLERYRVHIFAGNLSEFSKQYTRLGVRHYILEPRLNLEYGLGGFDVDIAWRGCPYSDGAMLQYAVIAPDTKGGNDYFPEADSVEWYDVPEDAIKNGTAFKSEGKNNGQIFFRIKKLSDTFTTDNGLRPICSPTDPICLASLMNTGSNKYKRANTMGQYFVSVSRAETKGVVEGIISQLVKTIDGQLFGTADKPGMVPKIFKQFVSDSGFVRAIRALMVLYIMYTGISFMIGIAQINQKEAMIRIAKLAVVTLLISQNSWDFFSTHLFNVFTHGATTLIAKIAAPMYGNLNQAALDQDPVLVFSIFDRPFQQLFSPQVWMKIAAILFSNFLGLIIAIVVIFACIVYVICIARAMMIYLTALLGIAILLLLAPVFISFILFKYTRSMFDTWVKTLISFVMQPVFVFTSIAMFNVLLLACLYTTLSFTACKSCFLGFHLEPIIDICIIPGFVTLAVSHTPPSDPFGSPIWTVSAALAFLVISQGMYAFCAFCSNLARTLVTGSLVGIDLVSVADAANPIRNIASIVGHATGLDSEARQSRQGIKDSLSSLKNFVGGGKKTDGGNMSGDNSKSAQGSGGGSGGSGAGLQGDSSIKNASDAVSRADSSWIKPPSAPPPSPPPPYSSSPSVETQDSGLYGSENAGSGSKLDAGAQTRQDTGPSTSPGSFADPGQQSAGPTYGQQGETSGLGSQPSQAPEHGQPSTMSHEEVQPKSLDQSKNPYDKPPMDTGSSPGQPDASTPSKTDAGNIKRE